MKNSLLIICILIIGGGCSPHKVSVYYSDAQLIVDRKPSETGESVDAFIKETVLSAEDVNTIVIFGKSYAFKEKLAEKIKRSDWFDSFADGIGISKEPMKDDLIKEIEKRYLVELVRLTTVINVGFHHPDPNIARSTADLIAAEYLQFFKDLQEANEWKTTNLRLLSSASPAELVEIDLER